MTPAPTVPPPQLIATTPARLGLAAALIIVAFGLLVLIPGILPSTRTLSSHEVLAAQPAREMLSDGHWIIPTYLNVPRLEKPPTTGWLIAASMALFRSDSEWAVRLPSLFSAIACSLIIAALAARWLGQTVGLLAGLLQLTTVWVQTQANLAEADMPLAAAVTLAFALFALGNVPHPAGTCDNPWLRRAFMAALGLAFLFKGPIALAFILGGCVFYILLSRQWRQFRFFSDPWGILLLLAIVAAWPIAAFKAYPAILVTWKQEIFGYADGETFGLPSPFWQYFVNIPLMLMPWFLAAIPAGIATGRRQLHRRPLALFLACWFLPGMCLLQFASYKSNHYTFPLLPPFSIVLAAGLVIWLRQQYTRPLVPRRFTAIAIVAAAVGGITWLALYKSDLPRSIAAIIAITAAGLLAVVYMEHRRRLNAQIVLLFATVAFTVIAADLRVIPRLPGMRSRIEFAQRINATVGPGPTVYLVGFATDEITWYLRDPLRRIDSVKDFAQTPLSPQGVIALTRRASIPELQEHFRVQELDTITIPAKADLKEHEAKRPVLVRLSPLDPQP